MYRKEEQQTKSIREGSQTEVQTAKLFVQSYMWLKARIKEKQLAHGLAPMTKQTWSSVTHASPLLTAGTSWRQRREAKAPCPLQLQAT